MNLDQVSNVGNVTSNVLQFTNPTTAFVTTGNVEVGTANLFVDTTTGRVGIGTGSPDEKLHVNGAASATHASLGTTAYPTLGGNWLTIFSPTFDGDLGDNHPDPDGGILFTNRSSNGSLPWGYYMGVVKDVASTSGTTQRFDIGKSYDLNSQNSSGHADTLTPYLTIDNGNVGIGTTSPLELLDIKKASSDNFIRIQAGGAASFHGGIQFTENGIRYGWRQFYDAATDNLVISTQNVNNAIVSNVMTMTYGGNVGIGTASPLEKLDVYGTSRISSAYPRLDFFCTTGRSTNTWGNSTGAAGDYRIYSNSDASDGTKRSLNFDYGQNTTHTTRMCINAAGNVGIGTTNPNRQLQIYGNSSNSFSFSPAEPDDTSVNDRTNFGATSMRKLIHMRMNGRGWYWGIINNASNNFGLGADGGGAPDPDIQCIFQNNGTFWAHAINTRTTSTNIVTGSGSDVTINSQTPTTFASVTITTRGNKVLIICSGDLQPSNGTSDWLNMVFYRGTTEIGKNHRYHSGTASSTNQVFAMHVIDHPSAGTYTYNAKGFNGAGATFFGEDDNPQITAIEFL